MFERKGNVNDDRIGNVCRPRSAVTESNADAVAGRPTEAPDIRSKYIWRKEPYYLHMLICMEFFIK
ncbi:hypothetical protein AVEN_223613-1, partial [Araneus ventricosus]